MSYYPRRLEDPNAVYIDAPSGGDDTSLIQGAIDQVEKTRRLGIVFLGPGRYRITRTIHVWPSIRVIGYGPVRPTVVLPTGTDGFGRPESEKPLFFFAGWRPDSAAASVPDANPGTFYSALSNFDIELENGNEGAVGVRARYAQHCFLAHMEMRLGRALAGMHEGGNVLEDVRFVGGRYGVWTSKPSPGWQFTVIDCSFEGQTQAAIREREAGLTLIRPRFSHVPTAVELEPEKADELWVKDACLEDVTGPAFVFGVETNPRNEINMEGVRCRRVPVFAALRESGKQLSAPAEGYTVRLFSHGLALGQAGDEGSIGTMFDARPDTGVATPDPATDLQELPPAETWFDVRQAGAKGDGATDDTEALRKAIADHRTVYLPTGVYVVRESLKLRPDSVLIGLHPGATQLLVPDATPAFNGPGGPVALVEAPPGGSNVLIGIGLYTGGMNSRAVAALWKAGSRSMMNDVRFLGGHGTPRADGTRENPYNSNHTSDSNPRRRWDSQYPSLWVTEGGGGTFLDIWTPSTFAGAGMLVSDTETEGRVYQMSSEHHVRNEVQLRRAAHWRLYALQTEAERGESGAALQLEIESCHDITIANLHIYRVISAYQPYPWAVLVSDSRDVRFRNVHCYSNSKVSYDASIRDATHGVDVRQREFARLDMTGEAPKPRRKPQPVVLERNARVERVAMGFQNLTGGAAGQGGEFYFIDQPRQRVIRWDSVSRKVSTLTEAPIQPVNLAADRDGGLLAVSYMGDGVVYRLEKDGGVSQAAGESVTNRSGDVRYVLPVGDWRLNQESLSHPARHFPVPGNRTTLVVGADFLAGASSWGVKSSPPIRSFGLAVARPGETFYVTDEAELTTWAAEVGVDGALSRFRIFAQQGGEGVAVDARGNVYIAAGQVHVYDLKGQPIGTIDVPERPIQLVFGGVDGRTLAIAGRTSLYTVRTRFPGRDRVP